MTYENSLNTLFSKNPRFPHSHSARPNVCIASVMAELTLSAKAQVNDDFQLFHTNGAGKFNIFAPSFTSPTCIRDPKLVLIVLQTIWQFYFNCLRTVSMLSPLLCAIGRCLVAHQCVRSVQLQEHSRKQRAQNRIECETGKGDSRDFRNTLHRSHWQRTQRCLICGKCNGKFWLATMWLRSHFAPAENSNERERRNYPITLKPF